jgi:hypothetical protein
MVIDLRKLKQLALSVFPVSTIGRLVEQLAAVPGLNFDLQAVKPPFATLIEKMCSVATAHMMRRRPCWQVW